MILSACGDSSDSDFGSVGPVIGTESSGSSNIPGGLGGPSPVQPNSSTGTATISSSSGVFPAISSSLVNQEITHFEGGPVGFSEISLVNANLKDNDGNDPSWVELYNTSDAPVDLKGFALTDNLENPRQWVFGNAAIPAKSHMIVFLSGKSFADYIPPSDSIAMIGTNCTVETNGGGNGFNWGGMGGMGDFGVDSRRSL